VKYTPDLGGGGALDDAGELGILTGHKGRALQLVDKTWRHYQTKKEMV